MSNEINNNQQSADVQQAVTAALKEQKKKGKRKKLIIIGVIAVILIIGIAAMSGGGEPVEKEPNSLNASGEVADHSNTVGNYGCVVKEAKLCKDYAGKDAVLITYEFTNNGSEATSFDVALVDNVFQDGVGLERAYLDEDTDDFDVSIKPGVTKDVRKAYLLRDTTTDLEVEITEWLSFSNDKIVTNVKISK